MFNAVIGARRAVMQVPLLDDGKGADRRAGDLIYSGELRLDKRFQPGDYAIYVLALGRPREKRQQDMQPLRGKQLAARSIVAGTLTVE